MKHKSLQYTPAYKNTWIKNIGLKVGQLNTIYIKTNSTWKNMFLFKKKEDTRKRKLIYTN